jgi:hypothetical protein
MFEPLLIDLNKMNVCMQLRPLCFCEFPFNLWPLQGHCCIFRFPFFRISTLNYVSVCLLLHHFAAFVLPPVFNCPLPNTQSQSQSYITTDSQSVSVGVEPNLGLLTRDLTSLFFFFVCVCFWKLLPCHLGALRGRICHLSVFVNTVYPP